MLLDEADHLVANLPSFIGIRKSGAVKQHNARQQFSMAFQHRQGDVAPQRVANQYGLLQLQLGEQRCQSIAHVIQRKRCRQQIRLTKARQVQRKYSESFRKRFYKVIPKLVSIAEAVYKDQGAARPLITNVYVTHDVPLPAGNALQQGVNRAQDALRTKPAFIVELQLLTMLNHCIGYPESLDFC